MPFKFNPFSGNFDQTGSGGGGASYIDGEVATYNDLPLDGTAPLDSAWLVRSASGVWPVSRKQAGIYIRTATAGSSRDADYTYAGTMPDVFSDANFTLYDEASTTRTGQFNLGSITAGQNRVLTWPDGNGTIARTEDFAAPPAIGSTTRNTIAATTLNANNGTITASAPVLDLSQTWNNAAVTFTGLRFNVTNTASAAASLLADFQVGGTSIVNIGRDGFIGSANAGINVRATGSLNRLSFFSQGATRLLHNNSILLNESDGGYGWVTSGAPTSLGFDTGIFRGGAGIIEQRNGANAQAYRLYNTFTDASNYERGFMRWSSNVLQIGTEKGGTGSARALEFQTDGITRLSISTGGSILHGISTGVFGWTGSTLLRPVDGNGTLVLSNNTQSDFGRLQFGGTTSSFPALKRSSTTLQVRLADDSADAPLSCSVLTVSSDGASGSNNGAIRIGTEGVGFYRRATNSLTFSAGNAEFGPSTFSVSSSITFGIGGNAAQSIVREAANDTGIRNAGNAQSFRIFNTFTSTTSFERANFRWASNEFIIDAEAGSGGGTLRGIKIGSATSSLLGFYGATPVDRPATVADPTGGGTIDAEARTAINDIIDRLQELGLIA